MELIKTVVRLSLSEAFNPWLGMREIIRTLGEQPKAEIEGPPIVMDLKKKKQRLTIRVRAIELEQEGIISLEESSVAALDKMTQGNSVSKFSEVKRVSHEAIYIDRYALPFHELLILFKNRFLRASELTEACTDVGLIFDQAENDAVKHYEFGPMAKEQLLSTFLIWPRDGLPDNFVFLLLKYELRKAFVFDAEYMRTFLTTANDWEANQAGWVFSQLKEKGA